MKTTMNKRSAHEMMLRFNIVLDDEELKAIGEKMSVPVNFGWRPSREEVKRFCMNAIDKEIKAAKMVDAGGEE